MPPLATAILLAESKEYIANWSRMTEKNCARKINSVKVFIGNSIFLAFLVLVLVLVLVPVALSINHEIRVGSSG
jgi:hypothetical protein